MHNSGFELNFLQYIKLGIFFVSVILITYLWLYRKEVLQIKKEAGIGLPSILEWALIFNICLALGTTLFLLVILI